MQLISLSLLITDSRLDVDAAELLLFYTGNVKNLNNLLLIHEFFIFSLGFCAFLLQISLLYVLRHIRMITTLVMTLVKSAGKLLSVGLMFAVVYLATVATVYLLFGTEVYEYRSFMHTCFSILSLSCKGFERFVMSTGSLGVVIIVVYALLILLLVMNVFVSILNAYLKALNQDKLLKKNDIVEYIINMFIGRTEKPKSTNGNFY